MVSLWLISSHLIGFVASITKTTDYSVSSEWSGYTFGNKAFEKPGVDAIICAYLCDTNEECNAFVIDKTKRTCTGLANWDKFSDKVVLPGAEFYIPVKRQPLMCKKSVYLVSGPYGVDDSRLSESSFHTMSSGNGYSALCARLPLKGGCDVWEPLTTNDPNDYVQVDFGTTKTVTGVVIEGRYDYAYYVSSFKVLYSNDCSIFSVIKNEDSSEKVFVGASSNTETVYRNLTAIEVIQARCVRIYPITYVGHKAMSFDILGC